MTMFTEEAPLEMVFIAVSPSELEQAADVLDDAGIEFDTRPDAFIRPFLGGSVYDGIGFYVLSGQAAFARTELGRTGLGRGVVSIDPTALPSVREFPLA